MIYLLINKYKIICRAESLTFVKRVQLKRQKYFLHNNKHRILVGEVNANMGAETSRSSKDSGEFNDIINDDSVSKQIKEKLLTLHNDHKQRFIEISSSYDRLKVDSGL